MMGKVALHCWFIPKTPFGNRQRWHFLLDLPLPFRFGIGLDLLRIDICLMGFSLDLGVSLSRRDMDERVTVSGEGGKK